MLRSRLTRAQGAVIVAAVLALGQATPAAAFGRCDPGRADFTAAGRAGASSRANPGVWFEHLRATLENDNIPYNEGGWTTIWLRLTRSSDLKNPGAYFMAGLTYSEGQGRITSTRVRVMYTNEEGTERIYDNVTNMRSIGDIPGSDTAPVLELETNPYTAPLEAFIVRVNGINVVDVISTHGAEQFNMAMIYAQKDNNGSQIPGSNSDYFNASGIQYQSSVGGSGNWFTLYPNGFVQQGTHGDIGYNPGDIWFDDAAC